MQSVWHAKSPSSVPWHVPTEQATGALHAPVGLQVSMSRSPASPVLVVQRCTPGAQTPHTATPLVFWLHVVPAAHVVVVPHAPPEVQV